jgi:protein-tyrosine-phosphatase
MAEGFAKKFGLRATSASTMPTKREVNPLVVDSMKEVGIDLSRNTRNF